MRLSSIGLIGGALLAGAVSASPVFADASISGSATFITPAGFTSTLSAETVAPANTAFITAGPSVITPAVVTTGPSATITNSLVDVVPATQLLGFSVSLTSLSLGTTATLSPTPATTSTFSAAAAAVLLGSVDGTFPTATNNIEIISAIIKAGAGVNGLD